MPSTPSGYVLPPEYYAVPGTTIRSNQHNSPLEDLAQGVNDCVARDGTRPMTGNLPMNGRKITGLATGTANNDAATVAQVNAAAAAAAPTLAKLNSFISAATDWVNRAVPVGGVSWHGNAESSIPNVKVKASGQLLSRTQYPELWAFAQANGAISDSVWLSSNLWRGNYSSGDGSTNFRVPDLNGEQAGSMLGLYLRGSGVGSVKTIQGDQIRNITGTFGNMFTGGLQSSGAFSHTQVGNLQVSAGGSSTIGVFNFSAANSGVPTGSENRPVSIVGHYLIHAKPFSFAE